MTTSKSKRKQTSGKKFMSEDAYRAIPVSQVKTCCPECGSTEVDLVNNEDAVDCHCKKCHHQWRAVLVKGHSAFDKTDTSSVPPPIPKMDVEGKVIPLPKEGERVFISLIWHGICGMQVCCVPDASDEEILAKCNRDNPSGTSGGWSAVVRDPKEHNMPAECAPGPCEDVPGRIHYLVLC